VDGEESPRHRLPGTSAGTQAYERMRVSVVFVTLWSASVVAVTLRLTVPEQFLVPRGQEASWRLDVMGATSYLAAHGTRP
jgi:hypothetical protein